MTTNTYLGEDKGNDVWNRSAELLSEITNRYPPFSKEEYMHTKGIVFERSETLGTGGTKCDFYLYKAK